jgi:L-alanine-DL-glutamate epimerase-like enolase superfamily enzyme
MESAERTRNKGQGRIDLQAVPMLHFASVVPNLGPHQEYRTSSEIRNGQVKVPTSPGVGINYDPDDLGKAEII